MSFLLKKIRSATGQHTIEYLLLITLVMAGIVIMGPYLIRGWNAAVKTYEESTVDPQIDPFLTEDVPPPDCICSDYTVLAQGDPDTNGCACNECFMGRSCTISNDAGTADPNDDYITTGCNTEEQCEIIDPGDPRGFLPCSCSDPLPGCDINADDRCSTVDWNPETGIIESRPGCKIGERCFELTIGSTVDFQCQVDLTCPHCDFGGADPKFVRCPNDEYGLSTTTDPSFILPVSRGGRGCSEPEGSYPQCEAECTYPHCPLDINGQQVTPGQAGSTCDCPPPLVSIPGPDCNCPRGISVSDSFINCGDCPTGTVPISPPPGFCQPGELFIRSCLGDFIN